MAMQSKPLAGCEPRSTATSGAEANRRAGFTLVEMMVVMTILLILATIAVLFVPRVLEQEKAVSGARMLVGWLEMAKAQALRDQAPRGVRLVLSDPNNPVAVSQVQFIQQPSDYIVQAPPAPQGSPPNLIPVRRMTIEVPPNGTYFLARLETPQGYSGPPLPGFTGGFQNTGDSTNYPVQPGDYLEICGGGSLYKIIQPMPPVTNPNPNDVIILAKPASGVLPSVSYPTPDYRIIRAPRVTGDEPMTMPSDTAIDLGQTAGTPYGPVIGNLTVDILFSPSGAVIGNCAGNDKIILYVRDITQPSPTDNEPQLVCIYTRTGGIAVHPVDMTPNPQNPGTLLNPFSFTADGRASGE